MLPAKKYIYIYKTISILLSLSLVWQSASWATPEIQPVSSFQKLQVQTVLTREDLIEIQKDIIGTMALQGFSFPSINAELKRWKSETLNKTGVPSGSLLEAVKSPKAIDGGFEIEVVLRDQKEIGFKIVATCPTTEDGKPDLSKKEICRERAKTRRRAAKTGKGTLVKNLIKTPKRKYVENKNGQLWKVVDSTGALRDNPDSTNSETVRRFPEVKTPIITTKEEAGGRVATYNGKKLLKVEDTITGIVWEQYHYGLDGKLEVVTLYNPVTGKRMPCKYNTKNEKWLVYPDEQAEKDIGYFKIDEELIGKRKKAIELGDIKITDKRKGVGKTINQWLALKTIREKKDLRVRRFLNHREMHICEDLFNLPSLVITKHGWEGTSFGIPIVKVGKKHLLDVQKDWLIVTDLNGKQVAKEPIYSLCWQGKADGEKIISKQLRDDQIRKERSRDPRELIYEKGLLKKATDPHTGTVWEKYHYSEKGLERVGLYNPVTGEEIEVARSSEGTAQNKKAEVWNIYLKGEKTPIGFVLFTKEDDCICQSNIIIRNEEDLGGKGIGKTVKRWLALTSAREGKRLRFADTRNPKAASINKTLYKLATLVVSYFDFLGKSRAAELAIKAPTKYEMDDFLREQEYFLMAGQQDIRIKVQGDSWINLTEESIPDSWIIYVKEGRLEAKAPGAIDIPIEYSKELYWDGEPDAKKIFADQKKEERNRKRKQPKEKRKEKTKTDVPPGVKITQEELENVITIIDAVETHLEDFDLLTSSDYDAVNIQKIELLAVFARAHLLKPEMIKGRKFLEKIVPFLKIGNDRRIMGNHASLGPIEALTEFVKEDLFTEKEIEENNIFDILVEALGEEELQLSAMEAIIVLFEKKLIPLNKIKDIETRTYQRIVTGITRTDSSRVEYAKGIKRLIEAGVLDKEALSMPLAGADETLLSKLSRRMGVTINTLEDILVQFLMQGATDQKADGSRNKMRLLCAEALEMLSEKALLSPRARKKIKKDFPMNRFFPALSFSDYALPEEAEALKILMKADLVDKRKIKKHLETVNVERCLSNENKQRDKTAEFFSVLAGEGVINTEPLKKKMLDGTIAIYPKQLAKANLRYAKIIFNLAGAGEFSQKEKQQLKKYLPLKELVQEQMDLYPLETAETLSLLIRAGLVTEQLKSQIKKETEQAIDTFARRLVEASMPQRVFSAQAIAMLIELGLIDREQLREKTAFEKIIKVLKNESIPKVKLTIQLISSLDSATLLDAEDLRLLDKAYIEQLYKDIYEEEPKEEDLYFFLHMYKELQGDANALKYAKTYLTSKMKMLIKTWSTKDRENLYKKISECAKKRVTSERVEHEIETALFLTLNNMVNEGAVSKREAAYRMTGKYVAYLLSTGEKIPKDLKDIFRLLSIELEEGGGSTLGASAITEACLKELPELQLKKLPAPRPKYEEKEIESLPEGQDFLKKKLEDATLVRAMGRTLVYKTKEGKYFAVKFLKENENAGKLLYESEYFEYLNYLKENKVGLLGEYPSAVFLDEQRKEKAVCRVSKSMLPKEMRSSLLRAVSAQKNKKVRLELKKGQYAFMAYEADNLDYFTYLHEVQEDQQQKAVKRNINDLFVLARYGLIHPDIIELFHNVTSDRADGGVYAWSEDIIAFRGVGLGAGRINAPDEALEYPNMRLSGPADFAEMMHIEDEGVLSFLHEQSKNFRLNLERFTEKDIKNFLFMQFTGNYLISAVLLERKRLQKTKDLSWKNEEQVQELSKRLKEIYNSSYKAFASGSTGSDPQELVDWQMFARQMIFFTSGEYKKYLDKEVPKEIFGLSGVVQFSSEGWGFVKEEVIRNKAALCGIRAKDLDKVIEKYFIKASLVSTSSREIPEDIYCFRDRDQRVAEEEEKPEVRSLMMELYKKYCNGWRFGGVTEDLGPINGPNPLTEMIKANYIYLMAAIGGKTQEQEEHEAARIGKEYTKTKVIEVKGKEELEITISAYDTETRKREEFVLPGRTHGPPTEEMMTEIFLSAQGKHKTVLKEILKEAANTNIIALNDRKKDLLGLASYDGLQRKKDFIALHKDLFDNPAALFHEMGEYLIKKKILELDLNVDLEKREMALFVSLNGLRIPEPIVLKRDDAQEIALKSNEEPHYLLRALQREVFGEVDAALTKKIKEIKEQRSVLAGYFEKKGAFSLYNEEGFKAEYVFKKGSKVFILRKKTEEKRTVEEDFKTRDFAVYELLEGGKEVFAGGLHYVIPYGEPLAITSDKYNFSVLKRKILYPFFVDPVYRSGEYQLGTILMAVAVEEMVGKDKVEEYIYANGNRNAKGVLKKVLPDFNKDERNSFFRNQRAQHIVKENGLRTIEQIEQAHCFVARDHAWYALKKQSEKGVQQAIENGATSIRVNPYTGEKRYSTKGRKLKALSARVYIKEGEQWNLPPGINFPGALKEILNTEQGAFLLTTGPFYVKEKALSSSQRARELTDKEAYERFGLKRVYDSTGDPLEIPVLATGARTMLLPVPYSVTMRKKDEGLEYLDSARPKKKSKLTRKHVYGLEFKGAGTTAYRGDNRDQDPALKEYIGKPGIFFDWEHKKSRGDAIGLEQAHQETIEREKELLARGADISKWTLGFMKLTEPYSVTLRIPVGDYRRVSALTRVGAKKAKAIIGEEGSEEFIMKFAGNYGHTLKKLVELEILQGGPGSEVNVDISGKATDFGDYWTFFKVGQKRDSVISDTLSSWIDTLLKIVDKFNSKDKEFKKRALKEFAGSFFGSDEAMKGIEITEENVKEYIKRFTLESLKIKQAFERYEQLLPLFEEVYSNEIIERVSAGRQPKGEIEQRAMEMIHFVAMAALDVRKYLALNGDELLNILGNNEATEAYLSFLRKRLFTDSFTGTIRWAERERYGIQGGLQPQYVYGDQEGDSALEVDLGIDAVNGSANINRYRTPLGTTFVMTEAGGLQAGPDELFMKTFIFRDNDGSIKVSLDTLPTKEILEKIARKLNKKVEELHVIIPYGERHIWSPASKDKKENFLFNALVKAGVPCQTEEFKKIKEEVEAEGVYKNGNICIASKMFPGVLRLLKAEADIIIGADTAGDAAFSAFVLKAAGQTNDMFRFESFMFLRDRRKGVKKWPNTYGKRRLTRIDEGILRGFGIFPEGVEIPVQEGYIHSNDILTENNFVVTNNGAMILSGLRGCSKWCWLEDPTYNEDMSKVTISFYFVGLSGDIHKGKITYITKVKRLKEQIRFLKQNKLDKQELAKTYYELAETYFDLGDLGLAKEMLLKMEGIYGINDKHSAIRWIFFRKDLLNAHIDFIESLKKEREEKITKKKQQDEDMAYQKVLSKIRASQYRKKAYGGVHEAIMKFRPGLGADIRKYYQRQGDILRRDAEGLLTKGDIRREKMWEAEEEGNVPKKLKQHRIEMALDKKAIERLEKAIIFYHKAMECFPRKNRRTDREQMEFELYQELILLSEELTDITPRRSFDWRDRQSYFGKIVIRYTSIAERFEKNGFNLRAIYFYKRAGELVKSLHSRGVAGLLGIYVRFKPPQLYEKKGWYEMARDEYLLLTDEVLLNDLATGPALDKPLGEWGFTSISLQTAIRGYLRNKYLSGLAVHPHNAERAVEPYEKLLDNFKEFKITEEGIIGVSAKDNTEKVIEGGNIVLKRLKKIQFLRSDISKFRKSIIYRHQDMSVALKEFKDFILRIGKAEFYFKKKDMLQGYKLAKKRLAGLIPKFEIEDVALEIEGKDRIIRRVKKKNLIVSEKVKKHDLRDQIRDLLTLADRAAEEKREKERSRILEETEKAIKRHISNKKKEREDFFLQLAEIIKKVKDGKAEKKQAVQRIKEILEERVKKGGAKIDADLFVIMLQINAINRIANDTRAEVKKEAVEKIKDMIRRMFEIDRQIASRGLFLPNIVFDNFGFLRDNRMVLVDMGMIRPLSKEKLAEEEHILKIRGHSHKDNKNYIENTLKNLGLTNEEINELKKTYEEASGISLDKLDSTANYLKDKIAPEWLLKKKGEKDLKRLLGEFERPAKDVSEKDIEVDREIFDWFEKGKVIALTGEDLESLHESKRKFKEKNISDKKLIDMFVSGIKGVLGYDDEDYQDQARMYLEKLFAQEQMKKDILRALEILYHAIQNSKEREGLLKRRFVIGLSKEDDFEKGCALGHAGQNKGNAAQSIYLHINTLLFAAGEPKKQKKRKKGLMVLVEHENWHIQNMAGYSGVEFFPDPERDDHFYRTEDEYIILKEFWAEVRAYMYKNRDIAKEIEDSLFELFKLQEEPDHFLDKVSINLHFMLLKYKAIKEALKKLVDVLEIAKGQTSLDLDMTITAVNEYLRVTNEELCKRAAEKGASLAGVSTEASQEQEYKAEFHKIFRTIAVLEPSLKAVIEKLKERNNKKDREEKILAKMKSKAVIMRIRKLMEMIRYIDYKNDGIKQEMIADDFWDSLERLIAMLTNVDEKKVLIKELTDLLEDIKVSKASCSSLWEFNFYDGIKEAIEKYIKEKGTLSREANAYFEFLEENSDFSEAEFDNPWNVKAEENYQQLAEVIENEPGIKGGVGLSVGPDQNLTLISVLEPDLWIVIDKAREITELLLPGLLALTEYADTPEEYIKTIKNEDEAFWNTFIQRTYPWRLRKRARAFLFTWIRTRIQKEESGPLSKWQEKGCWLSSKERYLAVKKAWAEGRVKGVSGDWAGKAPDAVIENLKQTGKKVKSIYLSNLITWKDPDNPDPDIMEKIDRCPKEKDTYVIDRDWAGTNRQILRPYEYFIKKCEHLLRMKTSQRDYYIAYGLEKLAYINSAKPIKPKGSYLNAIDMLMKAFTYFPDGTSQTRRIVSDLLKEGIRTCDFNGFYKKVFDELVEKGYLAGEKTENPNTQENIEKNIRKTAENTREILLTCIKDIDQTRPIDYSVDVSLISKDDPEDDIEDLAILILSYMKKQNINFSLEIPEYLSEDKKVTLPEEVLKPHLADKDARKEMSDLLEKKLKDNAVFFGIENIDEIIKTRINAPKRENAIEVSIIAKSNLCWIEDRIIKGESVALLPNQYPVALEDSCRQDQMAIKNFQAAFALGLAQATLVMAKEKGQDELTDLWQRLREKIEALYNQILQEEKGEITLDEHDLDNLLSDYSIERISMAIDLALLPVERIDVEIQVVDRDNLRMMLRSL